MEQVVGALQLQALQGGNEVSGGDNSRLLQVGCAGAVGRRVEAAGAPRAGRAGGAGGDADWEPRCLPPV